MPKSAVTFTVDRQNFTGEILSFHWEYSRLGVSYKDGSVPHVDYAHVPSWSCEFTALNYIITI